ncbi:hypothetical protein Pmar_PMAR011581 [Perkinsus marinus ATCC 50983]|uniref:Uncharacterized protein n=1 Tax=Perkinsus marinus (strain ATCC 50983 / TXsc) TaxID=423536 RepID=C5LC70_PERM5|nr:hypothetical protein Pmar_PMAR011581 [Perkinsus marinus ATCC 50983]EER05553.1 hypothetical protein Pmar_PMAR011581 [Perkinsus marinus ATCC 50983]|eukprot:XP_002773737.1 hypothetical protein Pmar_PMAR011581 [Perkinsus marinus ATCC 50983]
MGRLVRALENYGLTPQDAAGVAGTFLVVKYATLAAFVPACHYVQPIRRLFWHPSRELAGRMLEQYRLRSKVRGHGRSGAAVSGGGFSGGLGLVPQTARLKLAATRARQRAWLERQKEMVALRKAGWKGRFRGFKEQQSSSTWGRKVFEWSDKFAERASQAWVWRSVARMFRIPPKVLAWDVAEAFVTYKLTFIFHAPLELYIIVKWFKARRANLDEFMEESPKLLEIVEEEEPLSNATTRSRFVADVTWKPMFYYRPLCDLRPGGSDGSVRPECFFSEKRARGEGRLETMNKTLVFIHAMNPYGMAHYRRFNEENVDLNRNGLDAHEFHYLINERDPNVAGYGISHVKRAVVSAQYTKPSGLFYGGQKLQRSYEIMTEVLTDVGVFDGHTTMIDVHTGLGPSGIDTLITSDLIRLMSFQLDYFTTLLKSREPVNASPVECAAVNCVYEHDQSGFGADVIQGYDKVQGDAGSYWRRKRTPEWKSSLIDR